MLNQQCLIVWPGPKSCRCIIEDRKRSFSHFDSSINFYWSFRFAVSWSLLAFKAQYQSSSSLFSLVRVNAHLGINSKKYQTKKLSCMPYDVSAVYHIPYIISFLFVEYKKSIISTRNLKIQKNAYSTRPKKSNAYLVQAAN